MAWASNKVTTRAVLLNWVLSFADNFVGAIATAALMFFTTQYTFGGGTVGLAALNIANGKTSLAFIPTLTLGIMCNALVCVAVWMCFSARTNIDRVVTVNPADCRVRGGWVRTQHREYVLHSDRSVHQGRRAALILEGNRQDADGLQN
jgi:hypothetical protein